MRLILLALAAITGCCGDDPGCVSTVAVRFASAPIGYVRVELLGNAAVLESRDCNPYPQCGSAGLNFTFADSNLSATFRVTQGATSIEVTRELEWETTGGGGISCAPTCRQATAVLPIP